MKFNVYHLATGMLLALMFACTPSEQGLKQEIDWQEFMTRHDLIWEEIPLQWNEGAFVGNGQMGMMIYAIQGGLDAGEILGRTRGSFLWAANYGLFVIAVAVHASIGLRNVLREWLALRGATLGAIAWLSFALLLLSGLRAVVAVVMP